MDFQQELENLEKVSPVIRDMLQRHTEWREWLRARVNSRLSEESDISEDWKNWTCEAARNGELLTSLQRFTRRALIEIAFRDLAGLADFEKTTAHLSRLADWVISMALEISWKEVADRTPAMANKRAGAGFAVMALGKLGGAELNYSSDIDLIFCCRTPADQQEQRFYTRIGERLVQVLGRPGSDGLLYRVDMRLRPHGQTGPLVPTIESLENYYESWSEAWERQALIKVRPICGDGDLCHRFRRFAEEFTFARQMDDSALEEIKRVKHRSEKEYARTANRIHVKQGPGGIRDIEFYVQYLQLITGNRFPAARAGSTLAALRALGDARALLEGEESLLARAYVFLRTVEHRLQLRTLTPQAMIPDNPADLESLAAAAGFVGTGVAASDRFLCALNAYRTQVRAILEKIYLTPGYLRPREREEEVAQLLSERTPREKVRELLLNYGFQDFEKAWQNIRLMALGPAGHPLPPGERRAFLEIVFPIMEVVGESYDPDQALHHLESFAAASGNRVSFLRALASRRPHLARLSNLFAISNLCHQILSRHPEYFDGLARGIHLHEGRNCPEMYQELRERLHAAPPGEEPDVMRRYRQREMVRIAYRDLAELAAPLDVSAELSDLAEACLRAALELASAGESAAPLQLVALGKLGSRQMHYSSDLDLLCLYEDLPVSASSGDRTAIQLLQDSRVERLLELLAGVTSEGTAYKVDLRLRPEGASGLLARSWLSFLDHSCRYMQPWERQALVRSRIITDIHEIAARWADTLNAVVYEYAWDKEAVSAVCHLKRRIETETSRENHTHIDFKFGSGGISDLDFMVQLLQALHGKSLVALKNPQIEVAVTALRDAGVIAGEEAEKLLAAHSFQRRIENHYQLMEEWTSREISRESPVLQRLARSLGYRSNTPGESRRRFLADWIETAQTVRALVNKYFYGNAFQ